MTELSIDGPHSPDYTRQIADQLAECVRVLNHATRGDGLVNPGDAYELLGALARAAGGLPQLLGQVDQFLDTGAGSGRFYDVNDGDDAQVAVMATVPYLGDASTAAEQLREALDSAQQAVTNIAARE